MPVHRLHSTHFITLPRWLLACALAALAGCGTYEPAKPGVYRELGVAQAEYTCGYETPTASRFMAMRCRKTEDIALNGEVTRREADSIRTQVPEIK